MGRSPGWAAKATGRPAMRSPGRPPVARREHRQRFWLAISEGLSSEDAAAAAGVSPAVGARWFREGGGMPTASPAPLLGRYLSFAEREEIAILRAQGASGRAIARRLRRAPSTISREVRRNAATQSGKLEYRATTAQWHADRRAQRPKVAKLASNDQLHGYVQERLSGRIVRPDGVGVVGPEVRWIGRRHGRRQQRRWAQAWSPEQISNRLQVDFPDDASMRISHEAIYQALYVQGRGALRRELTACLRTGRALRVPRARTRGRGKKFVTPEIMISQRPAEADERAVPGHWEGDLILGLGSSAIGTLVERTTRFTMLLHLPRMDGHGQSNPPSRTAPRWPVTVQRRCVTRSRRRSRRCPSSCAARLPGTRERRWPSTRSCASTPARRSTSATLTAPGSVAATRTPTACCVSTSPKAPTCLGTLPRTSLPSLPHSTLDPARLSDGRLPPRHSTNTYSPLHKAVLRRPLEPELHPTIAMMNQPVEGSVARP